MFLGLQTRQQVRISRAELARDADHYWGTLLAPLRDNPEYGRLLRVGIVHWDKLTNQQKFLLNAHWLELPMALTNLAVLRDAKLLTPWQERMQINFVLSLLQTPGGAAWWSEAKFAIPSEARNMLDTRLSAPETLPPPWTDFPPFQIDEADMALVMADETISIETLPVEHEDGAD